MQPRRGRDNRSARLSAFLGVAMKSRLNLKAGQKGTKRLTERYGSQLLYVRYRYDEDRGIRLKTVELVIEEAPRAIGT